MALDTVSLGGYATYQYNVGLITAEEAGDRFIGLGLMALGGAGSLRAAGLTNMTVGQAGKVVANAITQPSSTVKALGGMMRSGAVENIAVLQSSRRAAWADAFGKPSDGLGRLIKDLPKGHQARRDMARMIREIRASDGIVKGKGLPDNVYAEFMLIEDAAVFRYRPGQLRIVDFLEEQVHWSQISSQLYKTYSKNTLEIMAKQRVLMHPELTPALRMEWLDDIARVRAGRYGNGGIK
jgi:hypothetical protein